MMKSIAKLIVLLGDVTQTLSIAYPFLDGGGAITMPSREGAERQAAFPVDRRDVAGLATTALSQKSSLGTRDDGKPCRHRRCATNGCFTTPEETGRRLASMCVRSMYLPRTGKPDRPRHQPSDNDLSQVNLADRSKG